MSNPTYNPGPGPYPAAPPPPPKKKRTGLIVLIVIAAIVIALIAACGSIMSNIASNLGSTTGEPGAVVTEGTSEKPSAKASDKTKTKPREKATKEPEPEKPYAIKATECERGDFGTVDIKIKVTNHTERKMQYWFDIAIEDTDGNTVGTGSGFIDNVNPGKHGTASVFATMTDEEYDGKIKCVIDVTDFGDI